MDDYILFKDIDGKYLTLKDCIEEIKKKAEQLRLTIQKKEDAENKENAEEKEKKTTIFYVTDPKYSRASTSICSKKQGKDAVILNHNIDTALFSHEQKHQKFSSRELMQI